MFFDSLDLVEKLALKSGTTIFVVDDNEQISIKNALVLQPEEKTVITIEQIRQMIVSLSLKQTASQFVIIRPADKLSDAAANAFLKNLEEPNENVHFVLVTNRPSSLLPTILSRSMIFYMRENNPLSIHIEDERIRDLAKRLISAKPVDLISVAEDIVRHKDGVRDFALKVVGLAIEMLYKSYYLTDREIFVRKLPKFLKAYEGIAQNGHIKLHLIADLC